MVRGKTSELSIGVKIKRAWPLVMWNARSQVPFWSLIVVSLGGELNWPDHRQY